MASGLLGPDSLVLHNNDVFPKRHALSRHERFHPAMNVSFPLLSVASLAASLDSTSTLSPVKGNSSPSTPRPVAAILIWDQYIGPCSAFSTPSGDYQWLRLPRGLRNAPLTSQRLVNSLFSGLIGIGMFCYLDDLIIVSKDLESHLHRLDLVFTKFEEAGLKAKLSKWDFLKFRIEFIGHVVVNGEGIHTVDFKIISVKHFPTPQNVKMCSVP